MSECHCVNKLVLKINVCISRFLGGIVIFVLVHEQDKVLAYFIYQL